MSEGDAARVSVFVRVSRDEAFRIFTEEIDLWWKTGPKYRIAGKKRGKIGFEPGANGRLFETLELPAGPRTLVVGTILTWDPPARLTFEWRGVNFKPHESTHVDVTFEPSGAGTLVAIEHRGWSTIPEGHPARHGLMGREFTRMIGMWWASLMSSYREHASRE